MPPYLMLAPVLLVAVLFLVLRVARRHRSEAGSDAKPERASEEVRLLRLQVTALTEALQEATGKARAEAEVEVALVEPLPEPDVEPTADLVVEPVVEPVEPEPVLVTPLEVEPLVTPLQIPPLPLPSLPTASLPTASVAAPAADHTAHAYTDLSRSLAGAGRMREAALAQWAADLRVLGPLLEGRGAELCASVAALATGDAAASIRSARQAASALVGPSVPVTAMLPDVAHLDAPASLETRSGYMAADVSADVMPDQVVRALETVLVASAEDGGDRSRLSVGLRCDLVAHVVPTHRADTTALVRDVLEPHERIAFDDALGAATAGRAS